MTGVPLEDFSTELYALHLDVDWCAAAQVQHLQTEPCTRSSVCPVSLLSFHAVPVRVFCLPPLPFSFALCAMCASCLEQQLPQSCSATAAAGHSSRLAYACGSVFGPALAAAGKDRVSEREGLG